MNDERKWKATILILLRTGTGMVGQSCPEVISTTNSLYLGMSQTRGRVLVVDDEIDIAQTLRLILETSRFEVDIFTDPKTALASFKTAYYNLAVIDVRMPEMNGFELYSEIKSIDNKIKVLFLTGLHDLHDYDDFKSDVSPKLHERHFIQKPVTDDEFLDHVDCILY